MIKEAIDKGESNDLLNMAYQEIKLLRDRLAIDRVYVSGERTKSNPLGFIEQKINDNRMLGSSDKISCIEIEVSHLKERLDHYTTNTKSFILAEYGQTVYRKMKSYLWERDQFNVRD